MRGGPLASAAEPANADPVNPGQGPSVYGRDGDPSAVRERWDVLGEIRDPEMRLASPPRAVKRATLICVFVHTLAQLFAQGRASFAQACSVVTLMFVHIILVRSIRANVRTCELAESLRPATPLLLKSTLLSLVPSFKFRVVRATVGVFVAKAGAAHAHRQGRIRLLPVRLIV